MTTATVDYVPRTFPTFVMDDNFADKGPRNGDNLMTARRFNKAKAIADKVANRAHSTILPPTSNVSTGDILYASYINNLLIEAKAL